VAFHGIFEEKKIMETLKNNKTQRYFVIGVLFIAIGIISMVQHLGLFIPEWLWSWHSLVLAIGLLIGYRKNFKAGGWVLLVILGGLFVF
jgi:cation transport ATPase